MKAISLWQPWASLIECGEKEYETRSWPTNHRGPIAIHAAKKWNNDLESIVFSEPFASCLHIHGLLPDTSGDTPARLPLGCIIATARLISVRRVEEITIFGRESIGIQGSLAKHEASFGDYSEGRFAWLLSDIQPLPVPIPYRGCQGLFDCDAVAASKGDW